MSEPLIIKADALEPLFAAWEEPDKHRVRAESGEGAVERQGRRPTGIAIAQNLRAMVKEWRDNFYFGASETTRHLLNHWFGRAHDRNALGGPAEFRYYFCQREAIETLIYLKEVRKLECLSQLIAGFGGTYAETAALGITEDEDVWSRYAFKMATGSSKTKVMSLAMVWSYFHALRENDSPLARHFVVIAPNLTVFERLKEDYKPEGGGLDIFDIDPLIPVEWSGNGNLTTILQDEASGVSTGERFISLTFTDFSIIPGNERGMRRFLGWVRRSTKPRRLTPPPLCAIALPAIIVYSLSTMKPTIFGIPIPLGMTRSPGSMKPAENGVAME